MLNHEFDPEAVRRVLITELLQAQARNPNYSMRAYARRLGLPQSALSEIISAKRKITAQYAKKIVQALDLSPQTQAQLLASSESDLGFRSLDMDTFHLIADWQYFAILSLAETEDFQSSAEWIARRLGISEKAATQALDTLKRLGLVNVHPRTQEIVVTGDQFVAISEVAEPAMKKAARQDLELAEAALNKTKFEQRDFTAMTLCFDPARMDEAKELIKKFRRSFSKTMESKRKTEVYKLSIQLFPLTERKDT